MSQRVLLAAAAAATAFVLVLFAVVLPGLSSSSAAPAPTAAAVPVQVGPTTDAQPQTAPVGYAVSAEQAGALTLPSAAGATLARTPTLGTYQGIVAYEMPL
ncbi:MAG TPA: peptidase, partial [Chloroflexaceae bacterium]|nr:peptidase [Chloroflexaceae bacterium]